MPHARLLAQGLAAIDGIALDPATIETNIVYFDVAAPGWTAGQVSAALAERGVLMNATGGRAAAGGDELSRHAGATWRWWWPRWVMRCGREQARRGVRPTCTTERSYFEVFGGNHQFQASRAPADQSPMDGFEVESVRWRRWRGSR